MSEPTSPSDPTPPRSPAPAPTFTYGREAAPGPALPPPAAHERRPDGPVPGARRRRPWDIALTVILLALGLLGLGFALAAASLFADPLFRAQLEDAIAQQGLVGDLDFGGFPVLVVVSHLALYLVALVGGILLLVTRRLAFWLPLAAGVLAAIVFWGGYIVVVFSALDTTATLR